MINGNMIAGRALVACPDDWGRPGVMTLIVNRQGLVYEKDLDSDTATLAAAVTEVDHDPNWNRFHEPWPTARPPALQDCAPRCASKQKPGLGAILDA